jgi:hypothetical protein
MTFTKQAVLLITAVTSTAALAAAPSELQFRRQAVQRMIFDSSQEIKLSNMNPSRIVGLDLMHPPIGQQKGNARAVVEKDALVISSAEDSTITRWVGGFNPIACYDVLINEFAGTGEAGLMFRDSEEDNHILITLAAKDGEAEQVRCVITKDGKPLASESFDLPEEARADSPIRLRAQMVGVGFNVFVENGGRPLLLGRMDFVSQFDLRRKELMNRFDFCLYASIKAGSTVKVGEANSAISPGIGQADIRCITYEDGSTYIKDGRLWILMSVRGGALAHQMQGVFSLDPSVFDVRFEGIILYDREDGLLRNDIASNIFYDRSAKEWRGFTTGFSAYGDPEKKEKKELWCVQSKRAPLHGISVMKAKPAGLVGNYEDPQCVYDSEAGKWRMLLCENHNGYKAVVREADKWDGKYEMIAGPVDVDSTGTQLQMFDGKYYALFGSGERKIFIRTYPDLKPAGELNVYLPPWNKDTGTRIWPSVVPLPQDYAAGYIALMMDRLNYPDMKGPNWTYGAMYLYHAK